MSKPREINNNPAQFPVILDVDAKPGLRACGEFLPGKPYVVGAAEADRLVSVKGFRFVDAADAERCKRALATTETPTAAVTAAAQE